MAISGPADVSGSVVLLRSLRVLEAAHSQLTRERAVIAAQDAASGLDRLQLLRLVGCVATLATWDLPRVHERGVPLSAWLAENIGRLDPDGPS